MDRRGVCEEGGEAGGGGPLLVEAAALPTLDSVASKGTDFTEAITWLCCTSGGRGCCCDERERGAEGEGRRSREGGGWPRKGIGSRPSCSFCRSLRGTWVVNCYSLATKVRTLSLLASTLFPRIRRQGRRSPWCLSPASPCPTPPPSLDYSLVQLPCTRFRYALQQHLGQVPPSTPLLPSTPEPSSPAGTEALGSLCKG